SIKPSLQNACNRVLAAPPNRSTRPVRSNPSQILRRKALKNAHRRSGWSVEALHSTLWRQKPGICSAMSPTSRAGRHSSPGKTTKLHRFRKLKQTQQRTL
ncbi:hypothetical protein M758_10G030100, partial [Ceratodon purpureus]